MSESNELDVSAVWDAWVQARANDPLSEPAAFAARYGSAAQAVLVEIELGLALEAARPPGMPLDLAEPDSGLTFGAHAVIGEIGRGGFGVVFHGRGPDGEVAVKVVNPLLTAGSLQQAALLEEARMLQKLEHPNLVRLVDCGLQRGHFWIAMELVHGVHLDRLPPLGEPERYARAIDIGLVLCDALAYVHAQGLVHCDLKPSNVLVDQTGEVKILDFGLAQREEVSVTVDSSRVQGGTPAFMAPEQLDPEGRTGPYTDQHAIGYLLLLLVRPEVADEMRSSKRLTRIRLGELSELPATCFQGVPAPLRHVIQRCLEPLVQDRYADLTELREDLCAVREQRRLVHGRPGIAIRSLRRWVRRPMPALVVATVLLLFVYGVYAYMWNPKVGVRIDTFLAGKRIWIDGKPVGISPVTVPLREGDYHMSARWGDESQPTYHADFSVQRRQPKALTFAFNPEMKVGWVPENPFELVPEGEGAWIRVAIKSLPDNKSATLFGVPDLSSIPVANFVHTRLPFGTHELELRADGYRTVRRTITVDDELMHFWTEELDLIASQVRTLTVYDPFEEVVGELVEQENIRPYIESETRLEDNQHVFKRYFGMSESGKPASLAFWVEFDGPLDQVVVKAEINQWTNTWMRLEVGPDRERMVPIAWLNGGGLEGHSGIALPEKFESEKSLWPLVRGHKRLLVRYVLGPADSGEVISYGQALRTEGGPEIDLDKLPIVPADKPQPQLWSPAMTFRYYTL